jgi:hypothetical protein
LIQPPTFAAIRSASSGPQHDLPRFAPHLLAAIACDLALDFFRPAANLIFHNVWFDQTRRTKIRNFQDAGTLI